MKTKYFARFLNRSAHFDADLELVDILHIAIKHGILVPAEGDALFDFLNSDKHPRLSGRKSTSHGRVIAIGHLKSTLVASFIKDIYEDLTGYITDLIAGAARN